MHSGAFDVALGNLKFKQMSAASSCRRETRKEEAEKTEPVVAENTTKSVVQRLVPFVLHLLLGLLVVYSSYTTLPYVGTLVSVVTLELLQVAVLVAADSHSRKHIAIVGSGACFSLFYARDSMHQIFLGYPSYASTVVLLVVVATSLERVRHTDTLLVSFLGLAILSALLLRNVLAYQPLVVQIVESTLVCLCLGTYIFLCWGRLIGSSATG